MEHFTGWITFFSHHPRLADPMISNRTAAPADFRSLVIPIKIPLFRLLRTPSVSLIYFIRAASRGANGRWSGVRKHRG